MKLRAANVREPAWLAARMPLPRPTTFWTHVAPGPKGRRYEEKPARPQLSAPEIAQALRRATLESLKRAFEQQARFGSRQGAAQQEPLALGALADELSIAYSGNLARLGGDEFMVILPEIDSSKDAALV